MKRLIHLYIPVLMFAVTASPASAEAGQAIAHDGSPIYFEVHGSGDEFLFLGPGTARPRVGMSGSFPARITSTAPRPMSRQR